MSTSFLVSTDVTPGVTYNFKVSARNAHGLGTESAAGSIEASDRPVQMSAVTTALESITYVRISWSAPHDNSNAIIEYEILIKQKDGTYSELTAECDGSLAAIIT